MSGLDPDNTMVGELSVVATGGRFPLAASVKSPLPYGGRYFLVNVFIIPIGLIIQDRL